MNGDGDIHRMVVIGMDVAMVVMVMSWLCRMMVIVMMTRPQCW